MENIYEKSNKKSSLLLNTQIIADELEDNNWIYDQRVANGTPNLKHFSVYDETKELSYDTLYFVPESKASTFPLDNYSYISCAPLNGAAPHISNIKEEELTVINTLMGIFQKYSDFEIELDNIIINYRPLEELCRLVEKLFNNPCYVHDRNFSILAYSRIIPGMLTFEKSSKDGSLHIPLWLVDQFKFDEDYQQTLKRTSASIWGKDQYPHNIRSLYVNILNDDYYYGRLLINEITSSIKPGQYRMAEIFAEYVKYILDRDQLSGSVYYSRFEDEIKNLSDGLNNINTKDIMSFLKIRDWNVNDRYVCLVFQTQDENLSIRSETALRSMLVSEFKDSYDFIKNGKLYLILNRTTLKIKVSIIKNTVAQLVRDSYMYCGISNIIDGFWNLSIGFKEAEITLDYVKKNPDHWLQVFYEIALDYILDNVNVNLDTQYLISPRLERLLSHDEKYGTEYYRTLKSYLINERDITKTSKDLVIHRTTLTHRLEQMNKITPLELEKEDKRLYLRFSIRLYEKLQNMKKA